MPDQRWKKFIQKSKKDYYKIGCVSCPAFVGEKVYFTSEGFKHLIYKDRKYRPKKEQLRRIMLIPYAARVLKSSKKFSERRTFNVKTSTTFEQSNILHYLWSFVYVIKNTQITVVVRQIGSGQKHFLSIMNA